MFAQEGEQVRVVFDDEHVREDGVGLRRHECRPMRHGSAKRRSSDAVSTAPLVLRLTPRGRRRCPLYQTCIDR